MSFQTEASVELDYKLPLRQWIIEKVEHNTFVDVEWVDKEKQIFKIPWTKMHDPNWKEHWKIFQAWAKHGDKFDEENPYDSKYKRNLRCLMHKSEDFTELTKESVNQQQTGNCKFYRVLTPKEVKENRKAKRSNQVYTKHQKSKTSSAKRHKQAFFAEEPSTSSQRSQEMEQVPVNHSLTSAPGDLDLRPDTAPKNGYDSRLFRRSLKDITAVRCDLTTPSNQHHDSDLSAEDGDILSSANLAKSNLMIGSASAVSTNDFVYVPMATESERSNDSLEAELFLGRWVQEFNITGREMSLFDISIEYDGSDQLDPENSYCEQLDCSAGCRIFQGDESLQQAVIALENLKEFFAYPTYRMPNYDGKNKDVSEILARTDQGFTLKCDEHANLWVTRLSQSVLFYYDLGKSNEPIKLDRYKPVQLISYMELAKDVLRRRNEGRSRPSCEFRLYVGSKPRSPDQQCHVMVNITSVAARKLINALFSSEQNSMLVFSLENSLDRHLRIG